MFDLKKYCIVHLLRLSVTEWLAEHNCRSYE